MAGAALPAPQLDGAALSRRQAGVIFGAALLARLGYLAIVYHGDASLRLPDSPIYEMEAAAILGQGEWSDWTGRMPGYPLFLAAIRLLAGPAPIWPVLVQVAIDSVSCILIARLAGMLDRRLVMPAGILAGLNLNMIATSSAVLTESLFLLLFVASLIAALGYFEGPTWRRAAAAGLCLGAALLARSVLIFFLPLLLIALAVAAWRHRVGFARGAGQVALAGLVAAICVAPVALGNLVHWHRLALVSQGGQHALLWLAPAVREFALGIPFEQSQAEMALRLGRALAEQHRPNPLPNPFEQAEMEEQVAGQALREVGVGGLLEAWVVGTAINLMAPALVAVPPVATMERPHFYNTVGGSALGKVWAFSARAIGTAFFWLMIPALFWTVLARLVELVALRRVFRRGGLPFGPSLYLMAASAYFVAITGPVTGVKYRLPLEPFLIVLLASGLTFFADLWRAGKAGSARRAAAA